MRRKLQESIYSSLVVYKMLYPILLKMIIRKGFFDERFDKIIKEYAKKEKNFFFIQIGANDGIKADPIYLYTKMYGWKGILVEPVKYIFKNLKENYEDGLIFENVAIANKNGFKKFYRLKKINDDVPLWCDEIGSFIKKNVIKYEDKIKNLRKYLIIEDIRCLTLKSLLNKHKVKKIDLLMIDTEGYDYNILKQIPFGKIKPKIIIYEDRHFNDVIKKKCQKLLIKNGYTIIRGVDCLAYIK